MGQHKEIQANEQRYNSRKLLDSGNKKTNRIMHETHEGYNTGALSGNREDNRPQGGKNTQLIYIRRGWTITHMYGGGSNQTRGKKT